MKALKAIFGNNETKKSISNFSSKLDLKSMLSIKGGDGDPDNGDFWPPKTTGGN